MATIKYIVYYTVRVGGNINRAYPEYPDYLTRDQVRDAWKQAHVGTGRIYVDHEPHADYTQAFAAAGMVGADPDDVRDWLQDRVDWLADERAAAQQMKAAKQLSGTGTGYGGAKPGDIVRDQHGRSGRVPNVPLEVFRHQPYDPDKTMDAVRDFCKGGGSIPKGV